MHEQHVISLGIQRYNRLFPGCADHSGSLGGVTRAALMMPAKTKRKPKAKGKVKKAKKKNKKVLFKI